MQRLAALTVILVIVLAAALNGRQTTQVQARRQAYLPVIRAARAAALPMSQSILAEINGFRAQAGAAPLRQDARLVAAAQRHADDMAAHGFFDHKGSDGTQPWDRITQAGYTWTAVGENLA